MSIVRMSPELLVTIEQGAVVRVVEGGVPRPAKVRRAWIEHEGVEGSPYTFCVDVDDGIEGDRFVVFKRVREAYPEEWGIRR